jgi:hypothetical protein
MEIIILDNLLFRMFAVGNNNIKQLMNKAKLLPDKTRIHKFLIKTQQRFQKEIKNRLILIIIVIIHLLLSLYAFDKSQLEKTDVNILHVIQGAFYEKFLKNVKMNVLNHCPSLQFFIVF